MGHLDPAKLTELKSALRKLTYEVIREMTGSTPAVQGGMLDLAKVGEDPDERMGHMNPAKLDESVKTFNPKIYREIAHEVKNARGKFKIVRQSESRFDLDYKVKNIHVTVAITPNSQFPDTYAIEWYVYDGHNVAKFKPVKTHWTVIRPTYIEPTAHVGTLMMTLHALNDVIPALSSYASNPKQPLDSYLANIPGIKVESVLREGTSDDLADLRYAADRSAPMKVMSMGKNDIRIGYMEKNLSVIMNVFITDMGRGKYTIKCECKSGSRPVEFGEFKRNGARIKPSVSVKTDKLATVIDYLEGYTQVARAVSSRLKAQKHGGTGANTSLDTQIASWH